MLTVHNVPYALQRIRDVFPNEVSRSNKVSWYVSLLIGFSHLLRDACLLHKQAGTLTRQAPALASDR